VSDAGPGVVLCVRGLYFARSLAHVAVCKAPFTAWQFCLSPSVCPSIVETVARRTIGLFLSVTSFPTWCGNSEGVVRGRRQIHIIIIIIIVIITVAPRVKNSSRPQNNKYNIYETRMWVNAQRDGRPAEHRWHPLFNAANFG